MFPGLLSGAEALCLDGSEPLSRFVAGGFDDPWFGDDSLLSFDAGLGLLLPAVVPFTAFSGCNKNEQK